MHFNLQVNALFFNYRRRRHRLEYCAINCFGSATARAGLRITTARLRGRRKCYQSQKYPLAEHKWHRFTYRISLLFKCARQAYYRRRIRATRPREIFTSFLL